MINVWCTSLEIYSKTSSLYPFWVTTGVHWGSVQRSFPFVIYTPQLIFHICHIKFHYYKDDTIFRCPLNAIPPPLIKNISILSSIQWSLVSRFTILLFGWFFSFHFACFFFLNTLGLASPYNIVNQSLCPVFCTECINLWLRAEFYFYSIILDFSVKVWTFRV